MKKQLVFIAPHLSTGGLPQYLFKQIELLKDEFDIYCIEWDNVTGGVLVIQRNRIQKALGERLFTLSGNKHELFNILQTIKPDIIHLQEIPELFMQHDVADKLYSTNREYVLIETSHDSSFDTKTKKYLPDKFFLISQYQINMYQHLGVPYELVEHLIEYKQKTKTREQALRDLGLDPTKKHVINVGLFTPRKNQAEIIEYAKLLKDYPIQFHFIGNHADNFKFYWEPIMKDFPPNCKWWNERDDVDSFYEAADLFLFTSRGHQTDKETMPLVIREAIGWNTPSLIYNLPVYLDYFNKFSNIKYLDFDSISNNCKKILDILSVPQTKPLATKVNMNYGFNARWDLSEQKVYYSCQRRVDFPTIISVKEYKSDAVLWAIDANTIESNCEYWIVPIPKHVMSYENDPNFSGIKLCIYNKETGEQIYEQPFFHKFVNIPTVSLSNYLPYRLNYIEFFVDKRYGKWIDRKYDLVIDVGANAGVFTEYMLRNEFAQKVVAVECDSTALKDLTRNFKTHPRVTVIPKAFSHSTEPITFYEFTQNPLVSTTLSPEQIKNHGSGLQSDKTTVVPTVTLKEVIDTYGTIDLLKMDIEGGEFDILLNADASLFTKINNLFIECHFMEASYKQKYKDLLARLSILGYTVEENTPNQVDLVNTSFSELIYAYRK